ncbi:MAG: hypothetical protein AAF623_14955 [Planctomycetota bacterium]
MSSISTKNLPPNSDSEWQSFELGDEITTSIEQSWPGLIITLVLVAMVPTCLPVLYSLISSFGIGGFFLGIFANILIAICVFVIVVLASSVAVGIIVGSNWTLGENLGHRTAVVMFGGLSGFLGVSWMFLFIDITLFGPAVYATVCISIAMFFGCQGALIGSYRQGVWKRIDPDFKQRIQFEIRHILVLMVWTSLLLLMDRVIGGYQILIPLGIYSVLQLVFIMIDRPIYWYQLRRMRRKKKSQQP